MEKIITKRENGTTRVQHVPIGESKAKESMAKECDINNIMARYQKTGTITHLAKKVGQYGDFTQITDLRSALDAGLKAQDAFMGLPAEVRKRFGNDPLALVEFLADEKNLEEAIKLKLVNKRETPASQGETSSPSNPPAESK